MFSNRAIGIVNLKPEQIAAKYADRVRHGKTAKYHKNGGSKQNHENKMARANWQNELFGGSRGGNPQSFPFYTCNGKRSRALRKSA